MLPTSMSHTVPRSCFDLLGDYRASHYLRACDPVSKKLHFRGVEGRDVYNITAPFSCGGCTYLLGRVEMRDTEHSQAMFFQETPTGEWEKVPSLQSFESMQDPCITFIDGDLVLGGVKFPVQLNNGETGWRMEFYRGRTPEQLRLFLTGPDKMKDIRLKQLENGMVAVFSRPQGAIGGRGKIGFALADHLGSVTAELIENAPLLENQFLDTEWGGANEVHILSNGLLGVLGHIACFDDVEHRHYYPMVFTVNPETAETSPIKLIAERSDFPDGPSKRLDLEDVIFSGGLLRQAGCRATLYAGVSDAAASLFELEDPFCGFEHDAIAGKISGHNSAAISV